MAEEFDKNQEATPFKLAEARKKGQIGKSVEFPQFFGLLAMFSAMIILMGGSVAFVIHYTAWWIESSHVLAKDVFVAGNFAATYMTDLSFLILPVLLAGSISVILATIVHIGPVFSFFPLKPDLNKLNPVKGLKKIFSRRTLVEFVRVILKICIFSLVAYLIWDYKGHLLMASNHATLSSLFINFQNIFITLTFAFLLVFFFFSIFDLWFSKKEFARQMRMSTRDIKDENKRREGDPEIKAKRKKALRELLTRSASTKNVKDSDVIITNPTHIAIALKYRPSDMVLPSVVAKGQGRVAANIRSQAKKYGIPIIRKPLLARELMKSARIGDSIPEDKQISVANIYRWVVAMPNSKVFN